MAPAILSLLACALAGCGGSVAATVAATATPHVTPAATNHAGAHTRKRRLRTHHNPAPTLTPIPLYSQQRVAAGGYQLMDNWTYQFVEAQSAGLRRWCSQGGRGACDTYLKIAINEYSGDYDIVVSPHQFALLNARGARNRPVPIGEATHIVSLNNVFATTALLPGSDADYASGTLVFRVSSGSHRFSLLWKGHHVATFTVTRGGAVRESR